MSLYKDGQAYSAADVVNAFKGQTLGFDDVDVSGGNGAVQMPSGYGGLTWSDGWGVVKPSEAVADHPNSGYFTGITSGDQIAFNANAGMLEISAASFDIKTIEVTAAWDKQLNLQMIAYRGDKQVFKDTIPIGDHGPAEYIFRLKNITDIVFIPEHGVRDKMSGGSGPFLIFDDIKVSNVQSLPGNALSQHLFSSQAGEAFAADGHLATTHLDLTHHLAIA